MIWRQFKHPKPEFDRIGDWYRSGLLTVCVAKEYGYWHMSISHPQRYPDWDEIHKARYNFLPGEINTAILLPKKSEYVNIHPNCFHVYELPDAEVPVAVRSPEIKSL